MNKTNILCLKGFINIDKINKDYVYIYDKNELTTVIQNMKHFDNNYIIKLATGTQLRLHKNAILTGSIYEEGIIKNSLESDYVSNFKIDDYIYTPFKVLSEQSFKTHIKLDNSRDLNLVYLNTSVKKFMELTCKFINDKNVQDIINSDLDVSEFKGIISNKIPINATLINFLIVSLIKAKFSIETSQTVNNSKYTSKILSYRFNLDNNIHTELHKILKDFLNNYDIKFEIVSYDHYFYLNICNNYLYDYIKNMEHNFYKDILEFPLEFQKMFLSQLFKYTNNNFNTNPDLFHTIKELCYNNRKILNHFKNDNKSEHTNPVGCSLVQENESEYSLYPDTVYLEEGYLTRIVDKYYNNEQQRYVKDYLIIG